MDERRTLEEIQEELLSYGKAKKPCSLLYWECIALLRSMEFAQRKGPSSVRWYYGHRYMQSFRIYIEAFINSPQKLSFARDMELSCDVQFSMKSRPNVKRISYCPELMTKFCTKIYSGQYQYKRFKWKGVSELTQ